MAFCPDDTIKGDYLNGQLSENERIRFEGHLAGCPGCRREIAELRETAAAVAGLTPPSVPASWTAAVKDRLRAGRSSPVSPVPQRRRMNIFQYAAVAAGVTAAIVLLSWLVMGGTVERWFPGLSSAGLGIIEPRAARTVDLVALVLSLHALMFVPSIIDNAYQLLRRCGRKPPHGSSAGFFVG